MSNALASVPAAIDNVTYELCGDIAEMVKAEAFFSQTVHDVNLAQAVFCLQDPHSALSGIRQLLPCALRTFHPTMTWRKAQEMIDRMGPHEVRMISEAIAVMWPAATAESEAANRNLCCRLEDLAEANEFFAGKSELTLTCLEGPFTLGHAWRVFPCAVHRFRPKLSLEEARQLMTLESILLITRMYELEVRSASEDRRTMYARRTVAVASESEKQEIIRRLLAKQSWSQSPSA